MFLDYNIDVLGLLDSHKASPGFVLARACESCSPGTSGS